MTHQLKHQIGIKRQNFYFKEHGGGIKVFLAEK